METLSVAEELAKKQKEISIAEFFERNKHVLGFGSLTRAILTAVKEGVDNSLDACEEANILPEIFIQIDKAGKDEYKVIIEDNGPGIVKRVVPNAFGRLLYGSRFHSIRQSRGQQGIGISAVVMYAQLTTGKPTTIRSKVQGKDVAYEIDLMVDTKKNRPEKLHESFVIWEKEHGTRVEATVKARYTGGRQSVYEYLRATAIVNPHARIVFVDPEGERTVFERATEKMPSPTKEIKPHPEGIELGTLLKMAKGTQQKKMTGFLKGEFSRISMRVAREICDKASIPYDMRPKNMKIDQAKDILKAIKKVRIMAPPTNCLSPIGELLIKKGLKNVLEGVRPEFYAPPITREPKVYQGNPFQVEVGIVYGGELKKDKSVEILRFANRVPLLYQQGGCACTSAIQNVDWRRYGLDQRGGEGIPFGPSIILVHTASTKIPFTSESKEAIADVPVIREEIEKALRFCGRKLKTHLNKSVKKKKTQEKFDIVQKILPQIAAKSASILNKKVPSLDKTITKIMNVVWIDDVIEYKNGRHKIDINIYNYTPKGRKFDLHTVIPIKNLDRKRIVPKPAEIKGNKLKWELKRIKSTEKQVVSFELAGLDEDEYDENELYVSDINPIYIIGAEPLPGDWNLDDAEPKTLEYFVEDHDALKEESSQDDEISVDGKINKVKVGEIDE